MDQVQAFMQNSVLMNILSWIVFGLLVGTIVNLLIPGKVSGGVLGTIAFGIMGALVGGFVANLVFGTSFAQFSLQNLALAVGGAFVIAMLQRALFRDTGKIKTHTDLHN